VTETITGWMRLHLSLAVAATAVIGAIFGGVVTATVWVSSVSALAVRVADVEAKVRTMQATMQDNRAAVNEIRRALEANDATAREGLGRLDERVKAVEHRP
jgi:hypothetical protein